MNISGFDLKYSKEDISWLTQRFESMLRSGFISMHENVANFEREFALFCRVSHAIGTSTGKWRAPQLQPRGRGQIAVSASSLGSVAGQSLFDQVKMRRPPVHIPRETNRRTSICPLFVRGLFADASGPRSTAQRLVRDKESHARRGKIAGPIRRWLRRRTPQKSFFELSHERNLWLFDRVSLGRLFSDAGFQNIAAKDH